MKNIVIYKVLSMKLTFLRFKNLPKSKISTFVVDRTIRVQDYANPIRVAGIPCSTRSESWIRRHEDEQSKVSKGWPTLKRKIKLFIIGR